MSLKSALQFILAMTLAASSISTAQAGARLDFDAEKKIMTIRAHLVFFTHNRLVTEEEAKTVVDQIQKNWSGEPILPTDKEKILLWFNTPHGAFTVKTELTYQTDLNLKEAEAFAKKTVDPSTIFVRIVQGGRDHKGSQSRTLLTGGNVMVIEIEDLDRYTTTAHEFSHILGVSGHRERKIPGIPSIFYDRMGWVVEPQYTYDPTDPKSTLDPKYRRVTYWDIQDMSGFIFNYYYKEAMPNGGSGVAVYGFPYSKWYRKRESRGAKMHMVFSPDARPVFIKY